MESSAQSSTPPSPTAGDAPEVRARHPQTLLRLLQETAPTDHAAILAALGPEICAALDAADSAGWLPMEIDVAVIEATSRQIGSDALARLTSVRQREEMGSALFDGFVQTALRVFGASPTNMVRRLPTGWTHLFRNAGWVEIVSAGPRNALARFHRLPAMCIGSAAWMGVLPVGLRALYEIVGVKGTVECSIEDAAAGTALVTFRWK